MTATQTRLPIDEVLPQVADALARSGSAVLQAPPGAGKTTRIPPHILDDGRVPGRIIMLEPRRVATRTAAARIAAERGEEVGTTIGYRMRGEARTGPNTRIEVVTEGILTRMIQSDPDMPGIGCVIFDEFHERSIHADLGLALALEARAAFRPDLAILVMSATLDTHAVARLLGDAPVITSEGRAYPVETRWLDRPWHRPGGRGPRFEAAAAALVERAYGETDGGVLVFLPGAGEIARVTTALNLPGEADLTPLYGALPFRAQMAALAPPASGRRKVVLATSIAETSLTIPDIRVVVDCGRARRPRFDPGSGMTRLSSERVTRAEAEQRRGRAGRVAAGTCYRMWTRGEEGGMAPAPPVEIEDNDLAALALDLAQWGAGDAVSMPFLTPPPPATLAGARALLRDFGAIDGDGSLTERGRAMARLPLHPRLAHMLVRGREAGMGRTAATLAALLNARDPAPSGDATLDRRLKLIRARDPRAAEIVREIGRLKPGADTARLSAGAVLSLAYPDRIARRRPGEAPRYLMAGGKGALLAEDDPLAREPWLVAANLDGDLREARIRLAAPLSVDEVRDLHGHRIEARTTCHWDHRQGRVVAEAAEMLGAVALKTTPATDAPEEARIAAMLDGVARLGLGALPWDRKARLLQARAVRARASDAALPDLSDAGLEGALADWLAPHLSGITTRARLADLNLADILQNHLGWDAMQRVNTIAPSHWTAPTGSRFAIDYSDPSPRVSVRLQELLGLTVHPQVAGAPLLIEILSPAQRPIQTTADIAGFWASSYADVRKEMRGRYPKHVWPEDPARAAPTRRAKPRKG